MKKVIFLKAYQTFKVEEGELGRIEVFSKINMHYQDLPIRLSPVTNIASQLSSYFLAAYVHVVVDEAGKIIILLTFKTPCNR